MLSYGESRFNKMRKLLQLVLFAALASPVFATGGSCPASAPVTGSNCYFISAQSGAADSNNGTSESTPWLHAPGMPNCSSTCAGVTPTSGNGFILRGGDTWHYGNTTPASGVYTGGSWTLDTWAGSSSTCVYEGTQTGCIYWGVDSTWYNSAVCGAAWCRPIMNGDNATSGSTVASCTYQIGSSNQMIIQAGGSGYYNILDNLEMLGLCTQRSTGGNNNDDVYVQDSGSGTAGQGLVIQTNLYIHGWTATTTAGTGNDALACNMIGGGNQSLHAITALVIDGSDSDPQVCAWGVFPAFYHLKDSIVRYATQGIAAGWCHDIHDNIFEHFYGPNVPTHGNMLECNEDSPGNAPNQPQNTPNVVYNNIFRHDDPSIASNPDLWLCPTAIPEYWFNNLMYDLAGEGWSVAGPGGYAGCPNTGGQYMFNNTLVDMTQPCYLNASNNGTGGQYLTILNEHLINSPLDTPVQSPGCTGVASATNIAMSDATATSQGYTTGSAGTAQSNTCANESSKPCKPTLISNGTINAGGNKQTYCTSLASYTGEYAIGTEAANACMYGTTDGCSYNTSTHVMSCPAQTAVTRPPTGAWDSGAYQFLSGIAGYIYNIILKGVKVQ